MKTHLQLLITGVLLLLCFEGYSGTQGNDLTADGSVLTVKVQSESIANNMLGDNGERKVSIYLPPGYDENGIVNYPVVYMLPGEIGTNEDWFSVMGGPAFVEWLNKAIHSERIKPMILVFPDTKNKITRSWYTNSSVTGNWEDFIVNDLVSYIDNNFQTLPFPGSRGIAGRNVGGYGALKLATKHSDVFGAVYSINALVDFETVITDQNIWAESFTIASNAKSSHSDDPFANQLLGMALSFSPNENNPSQRGMLPKTATGEIVPAVYQKWLSEDPKNLVMNYSDALKSLKAFTVDCSTSDALIMLNSNYSEVLNKNGIEHDFTFFNGNDNSALAARVNDFMLPMFSEKLCHSLLESDLKASYNPSEAIKARLISDGTIIIAHLHMKHDEGTQASLHVNNDYPALEGETSTIPPDSLHVHYEYPAIEGETSTIPLDSLKEGIYAIFAESKSGFQGKSYMFVINNGTPQVKIHVTDSYTGKELADCAVLVNNENFKTDVNGQIAFKLGGDVALSFSKENYTSLEEDITVYTDTNLYFSIVKDSRIQVVEKGYGMPVFEATVTQNNQATLTGTDGYTTVQNLRDGMLNCRVFKPGYFTEMVNIPLLPGSSTTIELTKKLANVDFYVVSEEGPVWDIPVVLGDITISTDETGKASFTDIDTRVAYSWSVDSKFKESASGSFYLQSDTVLSVFLPNKENVDIKAGLNNGQIATANSALESVEFMVYPNPVRDAVTIQSNGLAGSTVEVISENGVSLYQSKIEGNLQKLNLSDFNSGTYFIRVSKGNKKHTERILKL